MNSYKNLLLLSQLCSPQITDYLFKTSITKIGQASPKFFRLLAEGLSMHNTSCIVETLSTIPAASFTHKKKFWYFPPEKVENIYYNYVPTFNVPILRNFLFFSYTFIKIILWNLFRSRAKKIIICDALGLSMSLAAIFASKITGAKTIAILTDVPGYMTDLPGFIISKSIKHIIYTKILSKILLSFDGYIFLTEQMNIVVNPKRKPYMVMEGLADINMKNYSNLLKKKASKRVLLYAGGIYEKYGVKKLIEAFMRLNGSDLQLSIYGSGELEKDMSHYMNLDSRIVYHGVVSNRMIIQEEIKATLLINPRFTNEEYTKYSFPSKNMEYMASGTPLVTTLLPGMPKDYIPYVFLFMDETYDGFYLTLKSILEKSNDELHEFGFAAKKFVIDNKSNSIQTKRILDFFEKTLFCQSNIEKYSV